MKFIKATLLTVLIGISALSTFSQKSIDKKVLMTIGDEKVTAGEFMRVYEKNNYSENPYNRKDVEDYLDLYINFKLKVSEAEYRKMDTSSSFITELNGYRTQLAKPYFIDESVNEELLKEAYNRLKKDLRASHILIMVDENATPDDTLRAYNKISNILAEVKNGKDFAEAAAEYSDDPSARDQEAIPNKQRFRKGNEGDLGYFTVFNMVYPFESAAYNTPVGEVSDIIRTKYGYHILKITDNKEAMGVATVSHIFVALRPEATSEDSARKAEKIVNIYNKIQDGLSYEDAVVEYSEDKGSVKNKGQLSAFTCNRVVPEFVSTINELEIGEISEPVRTDYGFHIIKLISLDQPGTFEDEKQMLTERLAKDARSRKSEDAVIAKIKNENKFKTYPKAITEIFAAIDTTVLKRKFNADSLTNMLKPVVKLKKQVFTQYDFAKYVQTEQRIQDNTTKDVYLNQLFKGFEDKCALDYMDAHLEEEYPEFRDLIKEYHDGILLFNLTDEMVWTKAVKDTLGLQEYFNNNRDKYKWGQRVDASVYKLRDKSVIERVTEIINSYDNDGDIAQAFADDSISSVRIVPDIYESGDDKYIDMVEWKVGLSDPINSDVEDLTVLIRIKEVIPPQQKDLDEARGIVTADYQNYLEENWISELKNKYPINVNKEVLESIIIEKGTKQ